MIGSLRFDRRNTRPLVMNESVEPVAVRTRIARAEQLAATTPSAASLLTFYERLVSEQLELYQSSRHRSDSLRAGRTLAETVERDAVVAAIADLLAWLPTAAPHVLADTATALASRPGADWRRRLDAFIDGLPDSIDLGPEGFVLEAALQPFAEACAVHARGLDGAGDVSAASSWCPFCGDRPAVAVLREAGHGARRSFVCGVCFTEWPAPRLGCAACGETEFARLPVFRDEALTAARVDACETCRVYLKTIDLTRDGHAVAVVDDLATIALDLWARGHSYRRLRPHLLRV